MTKSLPSDWFLRSRLKMRHVLLLAAIDEHKSLHKAAAALHMTQPAATRLLGDLEATLELKLFLRTSRGLTPTAHGASLIRHARLMLGTLDHARAELSAISDGAAGRIVMGTLLVVAPVLVPQALALFKRGNPRVTVRGAGGHARRAPAAARAAARSTSSSGGSPATSTAKGCTSRRATPSRCAWSSAGRTRWPAARG